MTFDVAQMRARLERGGARPTLFSVQITNPISQAGDLKLPFMCKAANLPASTVGNIEVPYFGRKIKIAGDRTFEDWTVTIINDEDFVIRNAMESWSNAINTHIGNLRRADVLAPESYKAQGTITQFSKTGAPIRTYKFDGLFPTSIAAIDMSWETNDTVEEFQVTFAFDWWEVISAGTTTGISTVG